MKATFIAILFLTISSIISGQSSLAKLNAIDPTEIIKSLGGDVVKEYFFSVDETKETLFIYEHQYNPESGTAGDLQRLYEVPIPDLSLHSLFTDRVYDQGEKIYLQIKNISEQPTIAHYWFESKELVSVQLQNGIGLGYWEFTPERLSKFEEIIKEVNADLISKTDPVDKYRLGEVTFKYGNERAMMVGQKDLDGKLYNDYILAESTDTQPIYEGKRAYSKTISKLKRTIEENQKPDGVNKNDVVISVINIGKNGTVDLYHPITAKDDFSSTLLKLAPFTPAVKDGIAVKSKIVFVH